MLDKSREDSFLLSTTRMNPVSYIKATLSELKQVAWPTRDQTIRLTVLVIVLSLAVGAYVGSLDLGFYNLLKLVLNQ